MTPALQGLRAVVDCGIVMHRGEQPAHLRAALDAGWLTHSYRLQRGHWRGYFRLKIDATRATNMLAAARRRT